MNIKIIDKWTSIHFIFACILTWLFLELRISIFIIIILVFLFEILEHSIIGDLVFKWAKEKRKERLINSIFDIFIGIAGVIVGYMFF